MLPFKPDFPGTGTKIDPYQVPPNGKGWADVLVAGIVAPPTEIVFARFDKAGELPHPDCPFTSRQCLWRILAEQGTKGGAPAEIHADNNTQFGETVECPDCAEDASGEEKLAVHQRKQFLREREKI
ncbi:MAG: hypothetical protein PHZ00_01770 [Candidatus Peribacteraceae bacterium]|nr:hypothetical protein [Candidatus Peribacteraceae bacterium]